MGRWREVLLVLGTKWMDRDSDMFCDRAKTESLAEETLFEVIFRMYGMYNTTSDAHSFTSTKSRSRSFLEPLPIHEV
jgi:hypothetical protein